MMRLGKLLFWRNQKGAAAVEMALMMPLLLAIMFGGFEASHYFYNEQKIVKAVRDGARFAGRLPFSAYTCSDTTRRADIQEVTRTGKLLGGTPLIRNWTNDEITVTVSCNAGTTDGIFVSQVGGARIVTVAATADYPSLFETLGFIDSTSSVNATAQAVVMGI